MDDDGAVELVMLKRPRTQENNGHRRRSVSLFHVPSQLNVIPAPPPNSPSTVTEVVSKPIIQPPPYTKYFKLYRQHQCRKTNCTGIGCDDFHSAPQNCLKLVGSLARPGKPCILNLDDPQMDTAFTKAMQQLWVLQQSLNAKKK